MTISRKWLACAVVVASLNRSSTSMAQCPGFPGCLYQPPQFTFTETEGSVTYTDIAGRERTINIMIRQPNIPVSELPVVVWSHGGAEGQTNARGAFDRLRPKDKYMIYINDSDTFHNIFALQTGVCAEKNVSQVDCMAFASWLKSAALAFLDFYVEGRPAAQAWLQNPYLKIASAGVAELERK